MSSPTSKIKVFTDVKFQPGSTLTRDTRNSFPLNPEVGMDTMANGVITIMVPQMVRHQCGYQ